MHYKIYNAICLSNLAKLSKSDVGEIFSAQWMIQFNNWSASCQSQHNDCAPSEDSHQPGNPPSLIRVFAVRMKKAWVLSFPLSAQRRLIRLGGCPDWSESSWPHSHFVCFVMRRLIFLVPFVLQRLIVRLCTPNGPRSKVITTSQSETKVIFLHTRCTD